MKWRIEIDDRGIVRQVTNRTTGEVVSGTQDVKFDSLFEGAPVLTLTIVGPDVEFVQTKDSEKRS